MLIVRAAEAALASYIEPAMPQRAIGATLRGVLAAGATVGHHHRPIRAEMAEIKANWSQLRRGSMSP
jgi:hypothetical protein